MQRLFRPDDLPTTTTNTYRQPLHHLIHHVESYISFRCLQYQRSPATKWHCQMDQSNPLIPSFIRSYQIRYTSRSTLRKLMNMQVTSHHSLWISKFAVLICPQHRGIFLTYPPSACVPMPLFSGTLFHAAYITDPTPQWILEDRIVHDLSSSKSLVLLYRISTYEQADMMKISLAINRVLRGVPLGREARSKELGEVKGNAALGGYDCVIVSNKTFKPLNNMRRLISYFVVDERRPGGACGGWFSKLSRRKRWSVLLKLQNIQMLCSYIKTVEVMAHARALAGPEDARTMVGIDVGGFRVIN